MRKNYRVVFVEKSKVELQECDMPNLNPKQMLVESIVSQISTGTELTMLEANVAPDSPWSNDIVFPNDCVGYSNVGRVIAVGEEVPQECIGRYVYSPRPHQKYVTASYTFYGSKTFIPEGVELEDATFSGIATVANASVRCAQIRPGDICVVFGAGIIGQMVARLAQLAGAGKVIVTDVSDLRLSKLPQDPAFIPVNSTKEDVTAFVKRCSDDGEGAEVVFETTSVPSLVEQELLCLRKMGKLIITSSPKGKSVVDFDYCSRKGITIIGAHNHAVHIPVETPADRWTCKRDTDFFLDMLQQKRISVGEMHTHRYHYTDAVAAYEMQMKDRSQALSVLLKWEDVK